MRLGVASADRGSTVSIHASVKDATIAASALSLPLKVSIHASVKDATLPISRVVVPRLVSIHASVKDATQYSNPYLPHVPVSIHASVKDATPLQSSNTCRLSRFNPRICKRCDSMFVKSFIDDTFKL